MEKRASQETTSLCCVGVVKLKVRLSHEPKKETIALNNEIPLKIHLKIIMPDDLTSLKVPHSFLLGISESNI